MRDGDIRNRAGWRPGQADTAVADHPALIPTAWGYALVSGGPLRRLLLSVAEVATGLAGVAFLALAAAPWVAPGAPFDPDLAGHRITASVLFATAGLVVLRYALQGFGTEAHIDRLRGEIRIVARNRGNRLRLLDCVAFARITAVSVDRTPGRPSRARLLLHMDGGDPPLTLLTGPADRLPGLAAALARDIERARTATAGDASLARLVPDFA